MLDGIERESQGNMETRDIELKVREHDYALQAHGDRLDKLENDRALINSMATSIAVMVEKTNSLMNKIDAISAKVDVMEQKPSKRWDAAITAIISAVVGILIGWVFTR